MDSSRHGASKTEEDAQPIMPDSLDQLCFPKTADEKARKEDANVETFVTPVPIRSQPMPMRNPIVTMTQEARAMREGGEDCRTKVSMTVKGRTSPLAT